MPTGIDQFITFVYTSDLERSHAFYAGALGLRMSLDQGACRIYDVTGSSAIGVCSHREPSPAGTILTIVTADVDGWFDRLSRQGVSTDGKPRRNETFGIYHFFATDPDGHTIEIQRFDHTAQPEISDDEVGWFA